MKENKSNVGYWNDWAKYEAIDSEGEIWQYEEKPRVNGCWWFVKKGTSEQVGKTAEPKDHRKTLIERYPSESETAPAETDAPDLLMRVFELERLVLGLISSNVNIRTSIEKAEAWVEALEAEVKELRESREMVHRFVPARTYLDDMRFVVPGAKSDVGVLSFTGGIETPTEPDPTAQKIEALKLLFPWRDGCEFMTVDPDGDVWQWGDTPLKRKDYWSSLDLDSDYSLKVGQISPDPELFKTIIRRHEQ